MVALGIVLGCDRREPPIAGIPALKASRASNPPPPPTLIANADILHTPAHTHTLSISIYRRSPPIRHRHAVVYKVHDSAATILVAVKALIIAVAVAVVAAAANSCRYRTFSIGNIASIVSPNIQIVSE